MENLLQIVSNLTDKLRTLIVQKNIQTTASKRLYETALTFIGRDASPLDLAPDSVACAESVNNICKVAFGEPVGGGTSTYWLYIALKNHKKFVRVTSPLAGDIIISPTGIGGGKNGVTSGHTGIVGESGKIMSNASNNGKWEYNYDLYSWQYRYSTLGGYQVNFFRRVI